MLTHCLFSRAWHTSPDAETGDQSKDMRAGGVLWHACIQCSTGGSPGLEGAGRAGGQWEKSEEAVAAVERWWWRQLWQCW